jgi:hypothetical protein
VTTSDAATSPARAGDGREAPEAALGSIHASLDVLGPAGLYATQIHGRGLPWIFAAVLAAWTLGPLALAYLLFVLRGDA